MREYVSQFREYLTEKKAVSENTLQSYMRDIQHFLTFMKEHQFTDLLKADDAFICGGTDPSESFKCDYYTAFGLHTLFLSISDAELSYNGESGKTY